MLLNILTLRRFLLNKKEFSHSNIVSINRTDKPINHLNILHQLAVNFGSFANLNMLYKLVNNSPVNILQVQVFANASRPLFSRRSRLLQGCQISLQTLQQLRISGAFLLILPHKQHKSFSIKCAADFIFIEFRTALGQFLQMEQCQ